MTFDPKAAIDQIETLDQQIREHFGYVERWHRVELADETDSPWMLTRRGEAVVQSDEPFTAEGVESGKAIYCHEVRGQVLRKDGYALIEFDTHTDGNKFLGLFDEALECKDAALIELCDECW